MTEKTGPELAPDYSAFALKIFGAAVDASEASRAGRSETKALKLSARQAERQGQERLDDFTRYGSAFKAASRAARSASGIAMTGSALLVDESTVRQIVRGQQRIQRDTQNEVREIKRQAKNAKKRSNFLRNFVGGLA